MLLSFRFANHRSFRDEQHLNLIPVYETGVDPDTENVLRGVPVVGIFGANASGKSNVIRAFECMRHTVGTSDQQSEPGLAQRRQREPFRLIPEAAREPSSYAVHLLVNGVRHNYGFTLDDEQILEEWLYSYPHLRKRVIFERDKQDFRWGEETSRSSIKKLVGVVAESLPPSALFLSAMARFRGQSAQDAGEDKASASLHGTFSELWQKASSVGPKSSLLRSRSVRLLTESDARPALLELLRAADIGLENIIVRQKPDAENVTQVLFLHRGAEGDVFFTPLDESSGTIRLIDLAAIASDALAKGSLLLVDEIDASLHPLLTAGLVRLFQNPDVNTTDAQLIFTSHDATLLGSIDGDDVLRRDQIWFTRKAEDGSSELYALSEFKPRRQGENRQKRYLNGAYEAIPDISMELFERAISSRLDAVAE